ncbi:tail fiber assembly protein [Xenorhabdus stockiae]|uniref:tail fiber assembly protein n=1 Tax=Xenorhabdus stockiae TaxID=351614 RepID=UPI003CE9E1E2
MGGVTLMKYYKSEDNKVYAYESDGSQDAWIKPGLIRITDEEADAITNPPLTSEQLQEQAEYEKLDRIRDAKDKIDIWQDAVDLDMATKEEKAVLLKWKKYRVLLNRVDCSTAPDIVWPELPE